MENVNKIYTSYFLEQTRKLNRVVNFLTNVIVNNMVPKHIKQIFKQKNIYFSYFHIGNILYYFLTFFRITLHTHTLYYQCDILIQQQDLNRNSSFNYLK